MKRKSILLPTGIVLAVTAVMSVAVYFMCGTTTTTYQEIKQVISKSISCKNTGLAYPFVVYDNSTKKETRINVIFSDESIKNISLSHRLYYANQTLIKTSEAHNHANLSEALVDSGLHIDTFDISYSTAQEYMQISIFADSETITNAGKKFFLINEKNGTYPQTFDDYLNNYINQGFDCNVLNGE